MGDQGVKLVLNMTGSGGLSTQDYFKDFHKKRTRNVDEHADTPRKSNKKMKIVEKQKSAPRQPNKPKSAPREIEKPKSVPKQIEKPKSITKEIEKPKSVPKEIEKPKSVPKEIEKPKPVPKEIEKPKSVLKEIAKTKSVPKEIEIPKSVPNEIEKSKSDKKEIEKPILVPGETEKLKSSKREIDKPNSVPRKIEKQKSQGNEAGNIPSVLSETSENPSKSKERDSGGNIRSFSSTRVPYEGTSTNSSGNDHKDVMTSLFKGNPEIPSVPESTVTRISEKVFSDTGFNKLDVAPQIISNVEKLGFSNMTVVQQKSIPSVLEGKDSLIKSQTGSGKTLTYAIPIIHKLMMLNPRITRNDGLLALIIVPTRELALQSYQWFEKLCKSCVWVVPGYLIGGEKKKAEKARLRKGINILIATPGRLIDHVHHTKSLSLSTVKFLVIDEADRLLDLGYERSMTCIMESLKEQQPGLEKRFQTIMLSATLSAGVEKLAGMSLLSPTIIDVSHEDEQIDTMLSAEALATPENLSHYYVLVPAKLRLVSLAAFILSKCMYGDERKMIIFFATQDMVDYHTALFSQVLSRFWNDNKPKKDEQTSLARRAERVLAGFEDNSDEDSDDSEDDVEEACEDDEGVISFQKLHGSMTQEDRSAVFRSFKEASAGVLMCTDVAARGLDLPRVCWIVQFNAACTVADYVHRVGRTARVDAQGSAIIFLAPAEVPYIQLLEQHKIRLEEVSMDNVLRTLKFITAQVKSQRHALEESVTGLQLRVETLLLSDQHLHDLARKAYVSFVRSYASYPKNVREMFSFKALHLGHYAKSMGLRDTPGALGAGAAFRAKREMKERKEKKERRIKIRKMKQLPGTIPKHAQISEFDSGMDSIPKSDKHK